MFFLTLRVSIRSDMSGCATQLLAMVESLLNHHTAEAHLYEVMPYPRHSRNFRRHWW